MTNSIKNKGAIYNGHNRPVMVVGDKYGFVDNFDDALAKWEAYAIKQSSPSDVYPLQPNESLHGFGKQDGMYDLAQHEPVDDIDAVFDALIAGSKDLEIDDTEFLCTNGANNSFRVKAASSDEALKIAIKRFDDESDYILPINVESEDGVMGACIGGYDDY
ncbi:hypothetical protein ACTXGL_01430 [Psychrobacter sp. T6-6]|uniref:hypothetical protein n=1 Tax=Psychrobacter sp. T6-6 TaxID=3457452 RepID=UPI003FD1363B